MFKGVEIDPNDINWRMVEYTLRVNPELEPTDPKYVKKVITNGMDVAYKINKKSWPNSTEVQNPNGGDVDYAVVIGKTSKGKYLLLIGDLAEKKYIEEYRANNK